MPNIPKFAIHANTSGSEYIMHKTISEDLIPKAKDMSVDLLSTGLRPDVLEDLKVARRRLGVDVRG